MSFKKVMASFDFIKALINQLNPRYSEQKDQEILQEERVIGIEDGDVILKIRSSIDWEQPNGEIIKVPVTQDLVDEVIDSFIMANQEKIKERLLDELNQQLPNQ